MSQLITNIESGKIPTTDLPVIYARAKKAGRQDVIASINTRWAKIAEQDRKWAQHLEAILTK